MLLKDSIFLVIFHHLMLKHPTPYAKFVNTYSFKIDNIYFLHVFVWAYIF